MARSDTTHQLFICTSKHCRKRADCDLKKVLGRYLEKHCADRTVEVCETGCLGQCKTGPILVVEPDGPWFARVTKATAKAIVKTLIRRGRPVKRAKTVAGSPKRLRRWIRKVG